MNCRRGCGACCIAPSISSPLPGMPNGKPAGVPCIHLDDNLDCTLFDDPARPEFCKTLPASAAMCGDNRQEALQTIERLEQLTRP